MTTITDIDLLQGLRKQSPKAQQQMLERYGNDVFAQVARLVPGIENAEEVYQDVFIKVFRNIMMYDAEKSSLRTWIARIAYNESVSFLRHKKMPVIYYEDREAEAEKLSESEVEASKAEEPKPEDNVTKEPSSRYKKVKSPKLRQRPVATENLVAQQTEPAEAAQPAVHEPELAQAATPKAEAKVTTLTERDIPITRPENYKYTPEEIALLKKQANEAYLKWAQLELEIAKYNLEQTAQK